MGSATFSSTTASTGASSVTGSAGVSSVAGASVTSSGCSGAATSSFTSGSLAVSSGKATSLPHSSQNLEPSTISFPQYLQNIFSP